MDWYYGALFKPLVLLRPAWTVRVILEEQLRMMASGVTNVITHPAQMIARVIGKEKESGKNLLGSFEDNASFIDVTLNGAGTPSAIRRGYGATGEFTTVTRSENVRAWGEASFRNFMQHKFDPLSRRLAQAQLQPSAAKRSAELRKIIKDSHPMNYFISMLSTTGGKLKVSSKKILYNYNKIKTAKNIEILSVSNLMAEAIRRISNSTSVSFLFK